MPLNEPAGGWTLGTVDKALRAAAIDPRAPGAPEVLGWPSDYLVSHPDLLRAVWIRMEVARQHSRNAHDLADERFGLSPATYERHWRSGCALIARHLTQGQVT